VDQKSSTPIKSFSIKIKGRGYSESGENNPINLWRLKKDKRITIGMKLFKELEMKDKLQLLYLLIRTAREAIRMGFRALISSLYN